MKIWRCPKCDDGVRAPSRLRHQDARRYCLACSDKAANHLLVERVCPSLDAERARAEAQRAAQEERARDRAVAKRAAHTASERGQLEAAARRWLQLEAWGGKLRTGVQFEIRLSRARKLDEALIERTRAAVDQDTFEAWLAQWSGRPKMSSGVAYQRARRMVVTTGSDRADALTTILHEFAHLAAPAREGHGDLWRGLFTDAIREVTGRPVVNVGRTYHDLHAACAACVRAWLEQATLRTS